MIVATFPASVVSAGDGTRRRVIDGVAVPWDTPGVVESGDTVIFHRGSLDASRRPVLLRDHDRRRPIGRVIDAADRGDALTATARIAATAEGDDALVLAAPPDQVLGMMSVGVDPTDYHYDDAGVLHVHAGDWQELSLLTMGAYDAARVVNVAATRGEPPVTMTDEPTPDLEPDDDEPDDDQDNLEPEEEAVAAPVTAARGRPATPQVVPLRAGGPRPAPVGLIHAAGVISTGMRRAGPGPRAPRIQAALANLITTDNTGVMRPAYRAELVGLIDHGMPLVRALEQRPLPENGMQIEYPVWTAFPDHYAKQATQKTQIGTGAATIGLATVDVDTWAQGADISFQLMDRSNPSFIDAWLRAAAADAGKKYDSDVAQKLLAVANTATAGTSFVTNVKALFAALDPTEVPAGPLFLAISYDQWLDTIDVTELNGPAFWDMRISFGGMLPDAAGGGLSIFVDQHLPTGTMLLGPRNGAASYGGPDSSADIRVVDVSLLGVDIGVYFYAAVAIEYPQAFAKLTGLTALGASSSSSSKSK